MNQVKFLAFSDLHQDLTFDGPERLEKLIARAKAADADFIVHLGDFCRPTPENQFLSDRYNSCGLPAYHVLGNHDMDCHTKREAVAAFGMPSNYYGFTVKGFRFLVCDPNYIRLPEGDIDYSQGNFFTTAGRLAVIPADQLAWLEEEIARSEGPVVLLSHQSFENDLEGVANREEVQEIINRANRGGKRVYLCVNGHNHTDYLRVLEGVCYFDLNSCTAQWVGEACAHFDYPPQYYERIPNLKCETLYRDPISAVITLWEDGAIQIDGAKSRFDKRSPRELGHSGIVSGRLCTAQVLSARLNCRLCPEPGQEGSL